jgi:hypothetical protein
MYAVSEPEKWDFQNIKSASHCTGLILNLGENLQFSAFSALNVLYGRGLSSRMLMFFNRMVRFVQSDSTANYFTMILGYIGYMYGVGLEILLTI